MSPLALELSDPAQKALPPSSLVTSILSRDTPHRHAFPTFTMATLASSEHDSIKGTLKRAGVNALEQRNRTPIPDASFLKASVKEVQRRLFNYLKGKYPTDNIFAESETHLVSQTAGRTWHISSICGRDNYLAGSQKWSVGLSVFDNAKSPKLLYVAVYFPELQGIFAGEGSTYKFTKDVLTLNPSSRNDAPIVAFRAGPPAQSSLLPAIKDQESWVIRKQSCATYAMLMILRGEWDAYLSESEHDRDLLGMAYVIEQLGGKIVYYGGATSNETTCPVIFGNAEFMANVPPPAAPMAADRQIDDGGPVAC